MSVSESSTSKIFIRAGIPMIVCYLLLPLSFVCPLIDSTRAPYFDLSTNFVTLVYWISESGGKFGTPIIAITMLLLLISRKHISYKVKFKEFCIIALVLSFFAGGGAFINEHYLKESLKIPRPNIIWLASDNGNGPLTMTTKEFYELGDKQVRRETLANVLEQNPEILPMNELIKNHWSEETGYSFPSGHSFSALFFSTYLLFLATTYLRTKRVLFFYLLIPWALMVCYSRLILRVHTPTDITVGGLQGLLLGVIAWFIARQWLKKIN
jgi:phosphatidylglycerophosphatase B